MTENRDRSMEMLIAEIDALRGQVELLKRSAANRAAAAAEAQRFPKLVETMSEGLAVMDLDNMVTYINPALCEMMGYGKSDFLGHKITDFVHEEHKALLEHELMECRQGGREHVEIAWRGKDGHIVNTLVAPAPLFDDRGEHCGAFAVFTDLTERKRIDDELARERRLLRVLMAQMPDAIYVKDVEARYVTVNKAFKKMYGIQERVGEMRGKTDVDFFPEEVAKNYRETDLSIMVGGEALLNNTEERTGPDGEKQWLLNSKAPLHNRHGQVVGMVGVCRDITELKKAEDALKQVEEKVRLILEHSRDIAYKIDLVKKRFEYISPCVIDLTGYSYQEALDVDFKQMNTLIHPDDVQRVRDHYKRIFELAKRGQSAPIIEFRLQCKNGEYRWFSDNSSLLMDERNTPVSRVGTLRDTTDGKNAEQAVLEASRMEATATLAGGIAHDFNNLMTGVLGNAELLQMKLPPDERKLQNMLKAIATSAKQAGNLAQQMLAFARGGKYQPVKMDINKTVQDVLRFEEHAIPERITVETDLAPDLAQIFADATQMSQVVMNISLNAIEATPLEGKLRFVTRNVEFTEQEAIEMPGNLKAGKYISLAIEDTGEGMSSEVVARVFEPFYTTRFQGRGLGLAAAYGIVKNHDGTITVASEEGKGSVFTVYIPVFDKY